MYSRDSAQPPQRLWLFSMHTSDVRGQCWSSALCSARLTLSIAACLHDIRRASLKTHRTADWSDLHAC